MDPHLLISPLVAGLALLPMVRQGKIQAPKNCMARQCLVAAVDLPADCHMMDRQQTDSHCMAASIVNAESVVAVDDNYCLAVIEGIRSRK
jgi:hypothetical protein